jgi:hypothetical protein
MIRIGLAGDAMAATILRGLLDALVSTLVRRSAAEAERVPARPSVQTVPDDAADSEASEVPPTAGKRRLDHGFITDATAVVITRNKQGHWFVCDTKGQFRGAFLHKHTAVSFVCRHIQPAATAKEI